MVDRAFPTTLYQDVTDRASGKTIQVSLVAYGGHDSSDVRIPGRDLIHNSSLANRMEQSHHRMSGLALVGVGTSKSQFGLLPGARPALDRQNFSKGLDSIPLIS
jgi:hypothetical protein